MTRPLTVIKSVGPKLVPFFKTCAIFFVLFPNDDTSYPQWLLCISKVILIHNGFFGLANDDGFDRKSGWL